MLTAGESAIVHDPSAPTRLRIEAPATCGTATWRIDARAHPASSDGALALELRAGAHRYELRCSSGVRERGDVRVDRDRGIAAMPRTAPRTIVDTDGRPYSVLYQTLLPEILVRWPHAPASGPFALEVQHAGATRTLASPNASHQFASGDFVEGTHTLAFRAADGSRSPPTTLTIHFDNATPIASIRAPAIGVALVGTAHVEGTVAEGAHVSVAGTPIPIDHAERFASDVPVPADGCIAIRVALAGRSVHYYVRCAGAR